MKKSKQKISKKVYQQLKQGSILAYSLIVLSVMLVIAVGVSSVSIIGKKSASTTTSSTQTLQTADSGIKLAIKKIEASLGTDQVKDKFTCNGSGDVIMGSVSTGLPGEIVINFFKSDGTTLVACSDSIDQIANIRSIATYENTTRTVQIALAATSSGFTFPTKCGWKNLGGLLANPGGASTCGICKDSVAGSGMVLGYGFSNSGGGSHNFLATPKIYCCFYADPASAGGDQTINTPCP